MTKPRLNSALLNVSASGMLSSQNLAKACDLTHSEMIGLIGEATWLSDHPGSLIKDLSPQGTLTGYRMHLEVSLGVCLNVKTSLVAPGIMRHWVELISEGHLGECVDEWTQLLRSYYDFVTACGVSRLHAQEIAVQWFFRQEGLDSVLIHNREGRCPLFVHPWMDTPLKYLHLSPLNRRRRDQHLKRSPHG